MSRRRPNQNRRTKNPGGGGGSKRAAAASGGSWTPVSADQAVQLHQQAMQLKAAGRLGAAQQILQKLAQQFSNQAPLWFALGECTFNLGDKDEGLRQYERGIRIHDQDARYLALYADLLFRAARSDESLEWAYKAAALDPTIASVHARIARNLERTNRLDEAIEYLNGIIEQGHVDGFIKFTLAHLLFRRKDYSTARPLLEAALDDPSLVIEQRLMALNEYGHLLDRMKDYEHAFEAFRKCGSETANSKLAKRFRYDVMLNDIQDSRSTYTAATFQRWDASRFENVRRAPVFLVGFPRSGTTMTEQMLAAHPDVESSEEVPFIAEVQRECLDMLKASSITEAVASDRMSLSIAHKLRKTYWDAVKRSSLVTGDRPTFLDKLPLNICNLGLINVIFPDAKVLVALRDPRDVCLSCFFQHFQLNDAMIHFTALESTARLYAAVMDLYLHQKEILTLDMIEIKYEETVTDFENQARRMIDHLKLSWTDEVLRFHEKTRERVILTPSYTGVTEKVYTSAVARWKNYARHITEVQPILQPYLDAFGYES